MERNKQWILQHHKPTGVSNPLSKNLNHQTPTVKQDKMTTDINFSTTSTTSNTIVYYEDISIDYSQYYKESPITFEDLLSDESNTSNISSISEEEGFADAAYLARSAYEDRNILR